MISRRTKDRLEALLASPPLGPVWRGLLADRITIFILHRFHVPGLSVDGCCPTVLRTVLKRLRREGFDLIDLEEVSRRLLDGSPEDDRTPAVCFTVDDGYFDFAEIAAPIFLEFDCPATLFVTTGFVDGDLWHWWDQVTWLVTRTRRSYLRFSSGPIHVARDLNDDAQRRTVAAEISLQCTKICDHERVRLIQRLRQYAEVEIPRVPPEEFRPVSWSDAQALEKVGFRFAPHGVSHPVLTRASEPVVRREVAGSWRTIRQRLARPIGVFAYPNGDHGPREEAIVEELGLEAAVSMRPQYASQTEVRADARNRFRLPRLPFANRADRAYLDAAGFSRIPMWIRRRLT